MLYFRCPTCKTLLADKQLHLEKDMEIICNNTKISEQEKDKEKAKLLDKFEIKRYCCRMRALTYIDLVKVIQ